MVFATPRRPHKRTEASIIRELPNSKLDARTGPGMSTISPNLLDLETKGLLK
jgi:hypothetical protein